MRHDGQGLLPHLRVRPALVRRLPRRDRGRRRADVLHRPPLLVPVAQLRVREALGGRTAQPRRRRDQRERPAPHELRAVALRPLGQRDAAGRGDALRPQADGRRRTGRGRAERAQRRSRKVYRQVVRDAGRYAGPYRVRATLPDKLVAGREAEAEIQVVGAAGRPVPERRGRAAGDRRRRAAGHGRHRRDGIAKVKLTPTDPAAGVTLDATAASLPPTFRRSTSRAGARPPATASASPCRPPRRPPSRRGRPRRSRRKSSRRSAPGRRPGRGDHRHVAVSGLAGRP